jgi:hypothetical protein
VCSSDLTAALGDAVPGLGYRISGLAVEYDEVQPADVAAAEAGIDWRGPVLLDGSIGVLTVGDNRYQSTIDLRVQAPLIDAEWVRFNLDGGWSRINAMDDRATALEGSRYSYGASADAGTRRLSVGVGYRHLLNDRVSSRLSPDQDRYTVRVRLALPRWVVRAWGRYVESDYPTEREDEARDYGVDVAFRVHPRWELLVEASRLQNRSTDARFDYTTERVYTGLRFQY